MIKLHPETSEAIGTLINSIEVINDEKNYLTTEANYDWDNMDLNQRRKSNLKREKLTIEYNNILIKLYDDFGIELPCYQFIDLSDSVMKLEKAFQ
tara:strand:+ start:511 stop:795 length:285 start_codon:yes stop_codon:yes gene_type:complete